MRGLATLRYEVADAAPNGGSAKVVLTVRNRRGDVVKVLTLHDRPVNTPLTAGFRCKLPVGIYRFSVKVRDVAGNAGANVARNTLTVARGSSDD